jgi:hypothetical protein
MVDIDATRKLGSGEHIPPAHDSPEGHTRPQAPQFALSLMMFVHVPIAPQRVCPAAHSATHAPLKHVRSEAHAFPQRPQWLFELRGSVQTAPH